MTVVEEEPLAMPDFMEVCEHAARAAGQTLLDWQNRFNAREKSPKDLVTEADLAAQNVIQQIVRQAFPDHAFLGEESSSEEIAASRNWRATSSSRYRWIVDPLDGTANYVHGLPSFAVSIAIEEAGQLLHGVVFDPSNGECYRATRGAGATLNGRRLQGSGCDRIEQAMIACSFPPDVRRDSIEVSQFLEVLLASQSIRRLGSAALNLCYVGAGRLDGYWTGCTKIWDVAAGALIAMEAGTSVTNFSGEDIDLEAPEIVATATPRLGVQLRRLICQSAA